jgi:hypothetical protein
MFHLVAGVVLALPLALSSQTFFNNFELDAVGAATASDPSGVTGFRGNFPAAVVSDSSVVAPFGVNNHYLQFGGAGVSQFDGTSYSARAIVTGAPSLLYTSSVVKLSFDYYEANSAAWATHIGVATALNPWQPDLNGSSGLFAVTFDDGVTGLGSNTALASGALPAYVTQAPYHVVYYMNWTGAPATLSGPDGNLLTLEHKQIGFWMQNLTDNTFSSAAILSSGFGAVNSSVSLVFRNFSSTLANENVLYIDNLGVAAIPEPTTYAALTGLAILGLLLIRRRRC